MSYVDIIILVIFIIAGFNGYKTGLVRQIASLAGLLLGIWGAIHFSDFTASFLVENFNLTTKYLPLISFTLTFVVILIGVHFLGELVNKIFDLALLGFANSMLGVVFGVIKTVLILSVLFVIAEKFSHKVRVLPENLEERSLFYKPIKNVAPAIFPYLHFDEIQSKIKETFSNGEE
jgi:membrane protein required for colicin V production